MGDLLRAVGRSGALAVPVPLQVLPALCGFVCDGVMRFVCAGTVRVVATKPFPPPTPRIAHQAHNYDPGVHKEVNFREQR